MAPTSGLGPGWRAARFLLVGAAGVVVNQLALVVLHERARWPLPVAGAVAIETSILNNFLLNGLWTWRYDFGRSARRWRDRAIEYHLVALGAAAINLTGLLLLTRYARLDYRPANLIGIAAGSAVTFLASDRWVFRRRP